MNKRKKNLFTVSAITAALALSGCFHDGSNPELAQAISDWGGGSNSSQTTGQKVQLSGVVQSAPTGTSLSKVGGARGPVFGKSVTGQDLQGTAIPGALVLATDAWGNTTSDTAATSGDFTLDLESGKAYAIIFIDTRTMNVIGSLAQAADTTKPAAVALNGNTKLGNVVIDIASGKAVSQADATPTAVVQEAGVTVQVFPADSLDTDGDGKVTQDDITNLQAATLIKEGASAMKTLSPINFMGDRNTWVVSLRGDDGDNTHSFTDCTFDAQGGCTQTQMVWTGSRSEGNFRLTREQQVNGPDGSQITALKRAEVVYYRSETGEVYNAADWDGQANAPVAGATPARTENRTGFFDSAIAAINQDGMTDQTCTAPDGSTFTSRWCDPYSSATFTAAQPGSKFDWGLGMWGWSNYQYADTTQGLMMDGEWNHDTRSVDWHGSIPLDIQLGVAITEPPYEDSYPCGSNGANTCTEIRSGEFMVSMVDGGFMTDTLGNNLPIIKVTMSGSGTFTETDSAGTVVNSGSKTENRAMYILAKYGVEAPAMDANGVAITWQEAFKNARFGIMSRKKTDLEATTANLDAVCKGTTTDKRIMDLGVDKNFFVCSTMPASLGTVAINGVMPSVDGTTVSTATVLERNSWLGFLAHNIGELDKVDFNQFQNGNFDPNAQAGSSAFMWVERDGNGRAVDPYAWDQTSYMPNHTLTADGSTVEKFATTMTPDGTVDVDGAGASTETGVNVHYMGTGVQFHLELNQWDHVNQTEVIIATSTPVDVADATAQEAIVSIAGSMTLPALTPTSTAYGEHWTEYQWDATSNTETRYCSAPAGLALVMTIPDPNNVGQRMQVWKDFLEGYQIRGAALSAGETCDMPAQ